MSVNFHKIKIYAKVTAISLVILAALLFMVSNRQIVTVKFLWWDIWMVPTYAFIFLVANGGILIYLIARRIGKVVRELRQMLREDRLAKGAADSNNPQTLEDPDK